MTGRWPLPVFGGSTLPSLLQSCPACGANVITVLHALCTCPDLVALREWARAQGSSKSHAEQDAAKLALERLEEEND